MGMVMLGMAMVGMHAGRAERGRAERMRAAGSGQALRTPGRKQGREKAGQNRPDVLTAIQKTEQLIRKWKWGPRHARASVPTWAAWVTTRANVRMIANTQVSTPAVLSRRDHAQTGNPAPATYVGRAAQRRSLWHSQTAEPIRITAPHAPVPSSCLLATWSHVTHTRTRPMSVLMPKSGSRGFTPSRSYDLWKSRGTGINPPPIQGNGPGYQQRERSHRGRVTGWSTRSLQTANAPGETNHGGVHSRGGRSSPHAWMCNQLRASGECRAAH